MALLLTVFKKGLIENLNLNIIKILTGFKNLKLEILMVKQENLLT